MAITCDNASNNDALIQRLSEEVPSFGGQTARVCCFAHIVNLIVKSILSQFDAPKKNGMVSMADEELDTEDDEGLLIDLADGLIDDMENKVEEVPPEDRDVDNVDNADGWVDERKEMSMAEWKALAKDVMPAQHMVLKVSCTLLVHVSHSCHLGQGLLVTLSARLMLTISLTAL